MSYEPLTMPGMLQVYLGNGIGIWGLMLGPSVSCNIFPMKHRLVYEWYHDVLTLFQCCINISKKSMVGSLYTKTRYEHLIHFKPWHALPKICLNSYCSFQILHLKWACLKISPKSSGKRTSEFSTALFSIWRSHLLELCDSYLSILPLYVAI